MNEGEKAPAFALPDQDGRKVSLKDFLGNYVLVYFYPKDNTPGCTLEACGFRDVYDSLQGKLIVLGISPDSVESHKKFAAKHNLPFRLLFDDSGQVAARYGVWKQKSIFGHRYLGVVRASFLVDEKGIIRKIYRKVSPRAHPKEVQQDLK